MSKFITLNILEILELEEGLSYLKKMLSSFSCPLNDEIMHFISKDAIEFAKKKIAITHLMVDAETFELLGFYTLTNKVIQINADSFSKSMQKKLKRYFTLDENNNYIGPCYLIAQISKNYTNNLNYKITGNDILDDAFSTLSKAQKNVGGGFVYIECEDKDKIKKFYTDYGFSEIDERKSEEQITYKRMIRKLN